MIPRNRWYLSAAALAFISGTIGISELHHCRGAPNDWHGPAWVLTGVMWLYIAYRGSNDRQSK